MCVLSNYLVFVPICKFETSGEGQVFACRRYSFGEVGASEGQHRQGLQSRKRLDSGTRVFLNFKLITFQGFL